MSVRYYIGYDPRDTLAFEVAAHSCRRRASIALDIRPLKDWECRAAGHFFRPLVVGESGQRLDGRDGTPWSTDFSLTRFLIPLIEGYRPGWVLWSDPDVLWRGDVAELLALADETRAAMVVQHSHAPPEAVKMTGTLQRRYRRKNWTSVMLLNPARCRALTRYRVNKEAKDSLQSMSWLPDREIGALPEAWNWLAGWSSPEIEPNLVHFTRGTPDMPGHEDEPYATEWWDALDDSGVRLAAFPIAAR